MTEARFVQADVSRLQARLEGLDLAPGERAALDRLVALAGEGAADVTGFTFPRPAGLGDLTGFLSSGHTTGSNATAFGRDASQAGAYGTHGREAGIVKSGGGNDI